MKIGTSFRTHAARRGVSSISCAHKLKAKFYWRAKCHKHHGETGQELLLEVSFLCKYQPCLPTSRSVNGLWDSTLLPGGLLERAGKAMAMLSSTLQVRTTAKLWALEHPLISREDSHLLHVTMTCHIPAGLQQASNTCEWGLQIESQNGVAWKGHHNPPSSNSLLCARLPPTSSDYPGPYPTWPQVPWGWGTCSFSGREYSIFLSSHTPVLNLLVALLQTALQKQHIFCTDTWLKQLGSVQAG